MSDHFALLAAADVAAWENADDAHKNLVETLEMNIEAYDIVVRAIEAREMAIRDHKVVQDTFCRLTKESREQVEWPTVDQLFAAARQRVKSVPGVEVEVFTDFTGTPLGEMS